MRRSERPSPLFALLVLIGVYPLITLLSYLIAPLSTHWPIWLRTALLTPLMVFAMLYGLMPAIQRILRRLPRPEYAQPLERFKK